MLKSSFSQVLQPQIAEHHIDFADAVRDWRSRQENEAALPVVDRPAGVASLHIQQCASLRRRDLNARDVLTGCREGNSFEIVGFVNLC